MNTSNMRKIILALILSAALCVTAIPGGVAFAEPTGPAQAEGAAAAASGEQNRDGQMQNARDVQVQDVKSSRPMTTTAKPTTKPTTKYQPPVNRLMISGLDLTFKNPVNRMNWLSDASIPNDFRMKGKKRSIRLTWKRPANMNFDGYILLRKDGLATQYKEIKRLKKSATSYVDKKAKKKNKRYTYTIIPYRKGKVIRVSRNTAQWASGVTTRSKKKNAYNVIINNRKQLDALYKGSKLGILVKFPKKTYNTWLRYSSSNPNVASVDAGGAITARNPGTATIWVKTAPGNVVSVSVRVIQGGTVTQMLTVMRGWVGYSEVNKKHREIIDIYNSYLPHPRNYRMRYSDAWCDACISAAALKSGNAGAVGLECGVPSHVAVFKDKGIWIEDGTITPRVGDIIVFAWSKAKQPNDNSASHIGIVDSVANGKIVTIEGNYRDSVGRRTIPVGWGYIRGYARPNYAR